MSNNTVRILRKLENGELSKNRGGYGPNFIITIKLKTHVNLFDNLESARNAIRAWKSMHEILRAHVIKKEDGDFYFAVDENSAVNKNLENIQFLRIRYPNDKKLKSLDESLLYDLLFEKYMSKQIDIDEPHDILWKMGFVEMQPTREGEFVYEVFFFIHHIIGDGLSAKENLLLLLNLIEKTIKGQSIESRDFGVYPGSGRVFEQEISSMRDKPEQTPVLRPDFVDPTRARHHSSTSLKDKFPNLDEMQEFELIDLNRNGNIFATFSQLVKLSREESYQKPKQMIIEEDQFLKLVEKAKIQKVKVTSLLNTILWIAIFRMYQRHSNTNLKNILSWTAVNLRRFRPETQVNEYMLGYCVGSLFESIENVFENVMSNSEVLDKFWPMARQNDETLTTRVANDMEKFGVKIKKTMEENEMAVHTGFSNIGVINTLTPGGVFTIEKFFLCCYIPKFFSRLLFYNYVATVNNKIFWCIAYNSFFFDPRYLDEFIGDYKQLIDLLVNN